VKDYREILVWQRSHALTLEIYRVTSQFPKEEMFGLTSQMRRSAASIPANIAEGCGRDGDAELKRFMSISLGSACELDYQVQLARDLEYLDAAAANTLAAEIMEVRRMLGGFIQKLKA
jgi:four helix bundle protein